MIGSHIKKEKTYLKTLTQCHTIQLLNNSEFIWDNYPIQIFTGSTKSWNRSKIDDKDIEDSKLYINNNNIKLFIHSIYLINLSRPATEIEKAIECLKYDLNIGYKLNAKGVVVHVGKSLKMNIDIAINNMYNNIINILPYINESCPLLIETPAGQGTEILVKLLDFIEFYDRFTIEQQRKIKICIDTCHVYASGYCPMEYLNTIYDKYPQSIILVHYNDSKGILGCCVDRHEIPGNGYIGYEKMYNINKWCKDKNISMVMEL